MANPKANPSYADEFSTLPPSYEASASKDQPNNATNRQEVLVGGVAMDMGYVRSRPGLLKISEIVLSLIVAICAGTAESRCYYYVCGPGSYLLRVAIAAIIISIFLLIVYAFMFTEKIWFINWPATEFLNCLIFAINYFIGSCWLAANIYLGNADTAAVIFGFVTVLPYAASTWLAFLVCRELYRNWRARRSQRGVVTTTTTTTVVQSY